MLDILLDAGLDSVKMLPFLYLAYLLIEWIERTRGSRIEALLAEGSRWGAAVGALLGTIPQCGFSAMAASLYGSGVITLGTLMAVFIATSDEAIPMLLAVPERWPELAMLDPHQAVHCAGSGAPAGSGGDPAAACPRSGADSTGKAAAVDCHEEHEEEQGIWMAALTHTLQIFVYIFLFSAAIGILIALVEKNSLPASCSRPAPSSR
ncbi:MAG: putative manganese transporter [Acutalibacteraceae bacterium]